MKRFVKMFKPEFAQAILLGTKRQTIRPIPKQIPEMGDVISLRQWEAQPYRSRQLVIGEALIDSVVGLTLHDDCIIFSDGNNVFSQSKRNEFARRDGFEDWQDLVDWLKNSYGLPFTGILIEWGSLKGGREG